jgi:hypothetical protein
MKKYMLIHTTSGREFEIELKPEVDLDEQASIAFQQYFTGQATTTFLLGTKIFIMKHVEAITFEEDTEYVLARNNGNPILPQDS